MIDVLQYIVLDLRKAMNMPVQAQPTLFSLSLSLSVFLTHVPTLLNLNLNLNSNVFALTIRDDGSVQAVLSEPNSSIAPLDGAWEEVDIKKWTSRRVG